MTTGTYKWKELIGGNKIVHMQGKVEIIEQRGKKTLVRFLPGEPKPHYYKAPQNLVYTDQITKD